MPNLEYWVDGSAWPNPGPNASYAVVKNLKPYLVGTEEGISTNNRMELLAIIAALEDSEGRKCTIYSDSMLCIKILEQYSKKWRENGWVKSNNEPVANLDLVMIALDLYERSHATLVHVKGHSGIKGNEMADVLADKARKAFTSKDLLLIPEDVLISEYQREVTE